jgi:hypothetical protein
MSGACGGNNADHCCYVAGVACPHLEENTVEGRRWACGLRRELGDWASVHADPRYLADVKPHWLNVGMEDCGDYPAPGRSCGTCGMTGE